MKTSCILTGLVSLAATVVAAPPQAPAPTAAPQPPPPVFIAPGAPAIPPQNSYVYEQKPISSSPSLVSPQQAQAIIEKFKGAYPKLGSPRMLIYVNRDLVDEKSGMKMAVRNERVDRTTTRIDSTVPAAPQNAGNSPVNIKASGDVTVVGDVRTGGAGIGGPGKVTSTIEKSSGDYTYRNTAKAEPTLADKQTVRDVERLFGRPLRMGGASLADQRVATQLIGDKPIKRFTTDTEGEQARKDREALGKITDVVVEVLLSSRQLVIQEVSGDRTYNVPDIQVTAIQLKDAKIIAQASSSDILGKDRYAGRIVTNFDVRDITEAVALALMEDMLLGVK